ncbi:MAG: hypothetical protein EPN77_19365 [Candidimonas sp.]|nr:MAG: hypothetical protein EPN77_19365 [Candidimonas sp.]
MDTRALVFDRLSTVHGWKHIRPGDLLASKEYDSVVGAKQAVVWMNFDTAYDQFFLNGSFVSAGEDVLAICFSCIRNGSETHVVESLVDDFVAQAEKRIAGSYAVRLLRNRIRHT